MPDGPSGTWRVLTWNVRGSALADIAAIAEVVAGLRPDVFAVQEIQRTQAVQLGRALGWRHCWTRKHYPYTPLLWWRAEGLAILTPHALGGVWKQTISPGVSTWTYRHRVLLAATVSRGDERLRVYDTHLAAHREPDERIAQARRVAERVAADDAPLRVVAGDLNAHDEPEVIRELHAVGLRDAGSDSTHPSHVPRRRFDYVLVPEAAQILESFVPDGGDQWAELSDHLPLAVEFAGPKRL
jgi:endonuclease/exonuclease/phosphatase family metal-dependent hydrolase